MSDKDHTNIPPSPTTSPKSSQPQNRPFRKVRYAIDSRLSDSDSDSTPTPPKTAPIVPLPNSPSLLRPQPSILDQLYELKQYNTALQETGDLPQIPPHNPQTSSQRDLFPRNSSIVHTISPTPRNEPSLGALPRNTSLIGQNLSLGRTISNLGQTAPQDGPLFRNQSSIGYYLPENIDFRDMESTLTQLNTNMGRKKQQINLNPAKINQIAAQHGTKKTYHPAMRTQKSVEAVREKILAKSITPGPGSSEQRQKLFKQKETPQVESPKQTLPEMKQILGDSDGEDERVRALAYELHASSKKQKKSKLDKREKREKRGQRNKTSLLPSLSSQLSSASLASQRSTSPPLSRTSSTLNTTQSSSILPSTTAPKDSLEYAWSTQQVDEAGMLLEIKAPPQDSTFLQKNDMTNVLITPQGDFGYLRPGFQRPHEWSEFVVKTWKQAWARVNLLFEIPRFLLVLALLACFLYILTVASSEEFLYQRKGKDTWEQLILGDPELDWDLDSDNTPISLDGQFDIYDMKTLDIILRRTVRVYFASQTSVDQFTLMEPYVLMELEHDSPLPVDFQITATQEHQSSGIHYSNSETIDDSIFDVQNQRPVTLTTTTTVIDAAKSRKYSTPTPAPRDKWGKGWDLERGLFFNPSDPRYLSHSRFRRYFHQMLNKDNNTAEQTMRANEQTNSTFTPSSFSPSITSQSPPSTSSLLPNSSPSTRMTQMSAFNQHQQAKRTRSKNAMSRKHTKSSPPMANSFAKSSVILPTSYQSSTIPRHRQYSPSPINSQSLNLATNSTFSPLQDPISAYKLTLLDLGPFADAQDDPGKVIRFLQDNAVSQISLSFQLQHYTFLTERSCMQWDVKVVFFVEAGQHVSGQIFADDIFCEHDDGSTIISGEYEQHSHRTIMTIMCIITWALVLLHVWIAYYPLKLYCKIVYYYLQLKHFKLKFIDLVREYKDAHGVHDQFGVINLPQLAPLTSHTSKKKNKSKKYRHVNANQSDHYTSLNSHGAVPVGAFHHEDMYSSADIDFGATYEQPAINPSTTATTTTTTTNGFPPQSQQQQNSQDDTIPLSLQRNASDATWLADSTGIHLDNFHSNHHEHHHQTDLPPSQSTSQLAQNPTPIHPLFIETSYPLGSAVLSLFLRIRLTYKHYSTLKKSRESPHYSISWPLLTFLLIYGLTMTIYTLIAVFETAVISMDSFALQVIFALLAFGSPILLMPTFHSFPRNYTIWQSTVYTALPYLLPLLIGNFPVFIAFVLFCWSQFSQTAPRFETMGFSAVHLFAVMKGDEVLDVFTEVFETEHSALRRVVSRVALYLFSLYFLLILYKMIFGVVAYFLVGDDVDEADLSLDEELQHEIVKDQDGNTIIVPTMQYKGLGGKEEVAFLFEKMELQMTLLYLHQENQLTQEKYDDVVENYKDKKDKLMVAWMKQSKADLKVVERAEEEEFTQCLRLLDRPSPSTTHTGTTASDISSARNTNTRHHNELEDVLLTSAPSNDIIEPPSVGSINSTGGDERTNVNNMWEAIEHFLGDQHDDSTHLHSDIPILFTANGNILQLSPAPQQQQQQQQQPQ